MVHCSAQTGPAHVLQKLGQTCMVLSTNTGRVYRPKDTERLILYLKDINLPKPDKWGTCQLIAFLQQVGGFESRSGRVRSVRRASFKFSPFKLLSAPRGISIGLKKRNQFEKKGSFGCFWWVLLLL